MKSQPRAADAIIKNLTQTNTPGAIMIRLRAPDLPHKAQRGQRLTVRIVAEADGSPVEDLPIEASTTDGAAVIPPISRRTDATGQLEIPLLAPRGPGPITLIVASGDSPEPLFVLIDIE